MVVALFNHERQSRTRSTRSRQHAPRGGGRRGRRRLGGRVLRPRDRVDGGASLGAGPARPPPLEPRAPHARNTALDFARAPLTFVLDADDVLYPHGLARLASALASGPDASFAFAILDA